MFLQDVPDRLGFVVEHDVRAQFLLYEFELLVVPRRGDYAQAGKLGQLDHDTIN